MASATTKDLLNHVDEYLPKMTKQHPKLGKAFLQELGPAAMGDGALDKKQKELIALGIAIHAQCGYCIAIHVEKCLDAGATREEIVDACGVAVLMGGGPALMYCTEVMKALEELAD